MTRILLATTALVAFAGAAAADGHSAISFSGSAELGYNDSEIGDNTGFYSDLDIVAGFSAELDNGLTVAASLDLEDLGSSDNGTDYELSLTSATAGLYYGDTGFAAERVWVSAGSMDNDGFSEADGEEVLRAEATFGAVSTQVSYVLANNTGTRNLVDDLNQLSLAVSADFGNVNVVAAYQAASTEGGGTYSDQNPDDLPVAINPTFGSNGDFNDAEVLGLSVGTTLGGADLRLAYADTNGANSTGVSVSYPVGPVTVNASYVMESAADDNWDLGATYVNGPVAVTVGTDESDDWGIDMSYVVGNGLTVFAGLDDGGESSYVAASYDLGGGAAVLASFADEGPVAGDDEVGAGDYQDGTTVELSFAF